MFCGHLICCVPSRDSEGFLFQLIFIYVSEVCVVWGLVHWMFFLECVAIGFRRFLLCYFMEFSPSVDCYVFLQGGEPGQCWYVICSSGQRTSCHPSTWLDCISPLIIPLSSVNVQRPWSSAILCVMCYWLWMRRAQLLLIEIVSTDSSSLFYQPRVGEGDTHQMLQEEWRRLLGLILQTKRVCDWKCPAFHIALCPNRRQSQECQVPLKHHTLPWPSASLSSSVFDKPINDVPEKNKNLFHIRKFCSLDVFFVGRKKKKKGQVVFGH